GVAGPRRSAVSCRAETCCGRVMPRLGRPTFSGLGQACPRSGYYRASARILGLLENFSCNPVVANGDRGPLQAEPFPAWVFPTWADHNQILEKMSAGN